MLSLVEIDCAASEHKELQTRFQQEESHSFLVVDAVECPAFSSPSSGGIETRHVFLGRCSAKRGFIQIVHASGGGASNDSSVDRDSGQYRVFLTHVDGTPLESAIRCLRFAPCLYDPRSTIIPTGHSVTLPSCVYCLSFSNQVLCADPNTGVVSVLEEYPCRPSTLLCDGSMILVGDGRGRVHAYRGTTVLKDGGAKSCLWSSAVGLHGVTLLQTIENRFVLVATQNFTVVILDASTGTMLTSLLSENAPLVASVSVPLLSSAVEPHIDLYFASGSVSRFRCAPSNTNSWSAAGSSVIIMSGEPLHPTCVCPLWTTLPAGTGGNASPHSTGIALVGTLEGLVLIYILTSNPENGAPRWIEYSRVEVNAQVVDIHAFPSDDPRATVLVSTATGELWQWTMQELFVSEDEDNEEERGNAAVSHGLEDETSQRGSGNSHALYDVQPAPPTPTPRHAEVHSGASSPSQSRTRGDGGEGGDAGLVEALATNITGNITGRGGQTIRYDSGAGRDVDDSVVIVMDDGDGDAASVGAHTDASTAVPSSVAFTVATNDTTHDELMRNRTRPQGNVRFAEPQQHVQESGVLHHLKVSDNQVKTAKLEQDQQEQLTSLTITNQQIHESRDQESASAATGALTIHGLRQGRRMDPRRVQNFLDRAQQPLPNAACRFVLPGEQSTNAVALQRDRINQHLASLTSNTADLSQAPPAAVSAMELETIRYQFPIKATTFSDDDVVFAPVDANNGEGNGSGVRQVLFGDGENNNTSTQQPQQPHALSPRGLDDLVDATFMKYAMRRDVAARKKQAEATGPDINRHLCGELLTPTPSIAPAALFFCEHSLPHAPLSVLTMPMPLPPTAVASL